jgi:hypothetical protein
MKRSIISAQVVSLIILPFLGGCTVIDYRKAQARIATIETAVKIGDNIYEARRKLLALGFDSDEIRFGSSAEESYVFATQITEHTKLDWLGHGFDQNLNPWRNKVPYHVIFRSRLDKKIHKIEIK